MTRAVLEGVAYGLRDGLELMLAAGTPRPTQIRGSGGGLVSPLWRQILADVLDAEIATPSTSRGRRVRRGGARGVGVGWYSSVDEACAAMVSATPVAQPGARPAAYRAGYEIYRSLYPTLADSFHRLARGLATGGLLRAEDLDCAGLDRDLDHLAPSSLTTLSSIRIGTPSTGELDASAAVGHRTRAA